ncbi:U2 snRNP-associated SURP motif-containing protein-like isoform X2 [Lineus longissimus]|uniref:U2 snRNP-associated SURP motif-containing protein-like isoform X2 n=1 Tax=Lineus longissimus TaxID=88925 RepID=UPI00315D2739
MASGKKDGGKLPWGLKSDGLAPGSMKNISENKLKAFNIGTMNVAKKLLSKREQEEMKKKQQEEEVDEVYKEFVASFEDAGKHHNKTWVKGGVVNPDKPARGGKQDYRQDYKPGERHSKFRDDDTPPRHDSPVGGYRKRSKFHDEDDEPISAYGSIEKPMEKPDSKLYKPTSKLAELAATFSSVKREKEKDDFERQKPPAPSKKKEKEKKKSNLELFKEELKIMQQQREERHKVKKGIMPEEPKEPQRVSRFEPVETTPPPFSGIRGGPLDTFKTFGSWEDDTTTTNLYLGNLNPKMTEQQLCELFGRNGPLASVKIMWPRTDEERARGRNCGFVAFMNRKDGERALNALKGKEIMGYEMKLGWGKAVPIPPHPIYIPPSLMELTLPPPPSGLPFNAQPKKYRDSKSDKSYGSVPPPGAKNGTKDDPDKNLANAVVKVVIPTERNLLCVIHRMIEFVVREGPMFEAMIMNREISNPTFRFLFENMSPAHVYYRWKLFTILQGDSPYKWRTEKFRMFKNGSYWQPPPLNPYTSGMPEELLNKDDQPKKGQLTDSQRERFEDLLRDLTPEKPKVGDAMVWCMDHAESAEEIVDCISESLSILETPIPKKIARLFLISDILFNSSAKVSNASYFRKYFESKLGVIYKDIHAAYEKIDARLKAEQFKQKVMNCFRAWEDWAIYPNEYLINLQNIFLGLVKEREEKEPDLDGAPIEEVYERPPVEEDLDGLPLPGLPRGISQSGSEDFDGKPLEESDLDGMPLSEDLDGMPLQGKDSPKGKKSHKVKKAAFIPAPSKWETIDESALESQAMTTSKWDLLDQEGSDDDEKKGYKSEEDLDGRPYEEEGDGRSAEDDEDRTPFRRSSSPDPEERRLAMTEERRARLREIEVKVMKYQDELEAGKKLRKSGMSMSQQVERYRQKLLNKDREKEEEKEREREEKEQQKRREKRVKEWERARAKERERERADYYDRGLEKVTSSEEEEPPVLTYSSGKGRKRQHLTPPSSPSPPRHRKHRSKSPPSAYVGFNIDFSASERKRKRSRSRSPVPGRKSLPIRSVSPVLRQRSPRSPIYRRSRSRSPIPRHKHKHKKKH